MSKKKNIFFRLFLLFSLFPFLFSLSCKSAPPVSTSSLPSSLPLDSGASMYVFGNARNAEPFINLFLADYLNDKNVIMMLERTDYFAAALFQTADSRSYQITAWGNYPSFRARTALGFNRQWKRQRSSGTDFWYSENSNLSLSLNQRQLFINTSQDGPVNPVSYSNMEMSAGLLDFNENTSENSITFWHKEPGGMMDKILGDMGIPIRFPVQELFINITPIAENQYETGIRMQFENPTQARGVTALFTLASSFMQAGADSLGENAVIFTVLFSNTPVQNNQNLDIKSAILNTDELDAFLRLFI